MRKIIIVAVLAVTLIVPMIQPPAHVRGDDAPYWPTEGWQTSTPEEQGMDSAGLLEMITMAQENNIHSLVVIRHGYVVLDASLYPFASDQPQALYSQTKSVISALVGIAIQQGLIQSVDQSIWDFFPRDGVANMDARKEAITLRHLLTQSSGLDIPDADETNFTFQSAPDTSWVQWILDHPMNSEPGTDFWYTGSNTHLISAILTEATGMSAADYAQQYLFDPLGITDATWIADPQGISQGGNRLFMSPLSMAKIGYLYLHNGEWDGQQILSPDWVAESTTGQIEIPGVPPEEIQYAYLWWTHQYTVALGEVSNGYGAIGLGGQEFWVIPELDLIVVITGDLTGLRSYFIQGLAIPAIVSDTPAPANAEATAEIQSVIDSMAEPVPSSEYAPSEIAAQISGQRYVLETNDLGWQSIALEFQEQDAVLHLVVDGVALELPVGLDGVDRLSTQSLPPRPWWPLSDDPLALNGYWLYRNTFALSWSDVRNLWDMEVQLLFNDAGIRVKVIPILPYFPAVWDNDSFTTITGTPE